uniref:Uncharacterized protein n=1 Tax=Octopus bimaculoides TaxID=37653 RepID=A0A0L8GYR3_OCTBM
MVYLQLYEMLTSCTHGIPAQIFKLLGLSECLQNLDYFLVRKPRNV